MMRFIVWGLPLHTHTHSYVHYAFARAANYMGYETMWVPDVPSSNDAITNNSVVLCCGVSDKNLAYKNNVKYVLHNSDREDLKRENYINLQVYTHDVLERNTVKLNENLTFWEQSTKTLYQPWATDLLPEEIERIEPSIPSSEFSDVNWVGSVMSGHQGNYDEILSYSQFCEIKDLAFKVVSQISIEDNFHIIRQSRHTPAIQGRWQVEKGYIPCRIFKNISYGCWTETNSLTTADLLGLEQKKSIEDLFDSSEKVLIDKNKEKIRQMMMLIKNNHTYVNRVKNIISCLED